MKRFTRVILTAASTMLIALQLIALPASAQEDTGGSGLQVSPATVPLELIPGQSQDVEFEVANPTANPVIITPKVFDFSSDNSSGRAVLNTDVNAEDNPRSIRRYISGLESIELASGGKFTYVLNVSIPDGAIPGAYFGAVAFQAIPADDAVDSEGVAVVFNANVAPLILVTVLGDAVTDGIVKDVSAGNLKDAAGQLNNDNIDRGSLFGSVPDTIVVEIENTGETFLEPLGVMTVKNMFGGEIAVNVNSSIIKGSVLPGSTRVFVSEMKQAIQSVEGTEEFKTIGGFGRFTVEGGIGLVNGGQTTDVRFTFWVIPAWLWIVLGAIVFTLVTFAYVTVRKFRG